MTALLSSPRRPAALVSCGVRVDAVSGPAAVSSLLQSASGGVTVTHLCNAYTLSLARRDAAYAAMLNDADLNLADGTPLAWLGRVLRVKGFPHATRGPDLMRDLLVAGQAQGLRHYFFGSTPHVLRRLQAEISEFAPDALIVGVESPPFGDLDDAACAAAAARVEAAGADVLWVGLGTPRQDWAVDGIGRHLSSGLVIPVGAAFDFLAGTKPEAPRWLRRSGVEWVFRLATEPRRLWRRYLVGNAGFLLGVLSGRTRRIPASPRV